MDKDRTLHTLLHPARGLAVGLVFFAGSAAADAADWKTH